eukprot:TRINITY_DN6728_c0_g1_i1.p1 TRINITY_DN6728_c0_g1~~TRINITY_DN6728_c0_g1_i1.p1  ORF type:complete len:673 (-),score=177.69 TRINITY_DN6728_c0_g1_i1:1283-3301(-)
MAKTRARKISSGASEGPQETGNDSLHTNLFSGIASQRGKKERSCSLSYSKEKENKNLHGKACKLKNHGLHKTMKASKSLKKYCRTKGKFMGKKYMLRSMSNGARVLRSRADMKTKALPKVDPQSLEMSSTKSKRRRRKQSKRKHEIQDELLRSRKRVRYLLLKIGFEQSMIDAYSSEGWRGQSQEKIRPERELRKAASKILHYKHAIREIFHRLHSLSLTGSLEESAFDSDGLIYSEDIFCAKCGSKDLFPDNDIILCDGACDRGFHQRCLEPPLETENIPPGDEGWLCPECDCKLDCFNLINDYLGTNFEVEDSWEKVFPEAVSISSGDVDGIDIKGMESDSEDDDYDPREPELSSGNNTEFGGSENSNGDSDSENSDSSDVSLENDLGSADYESPVDWKKTKITENGDMESSKLEKLVNLDEDVKVDSILTDKRQRQQVDYKKLHEEVFGFSDKDSMSEDDEEWGFQKPLNKQRRLIDTDATTIRKPVRNGSVANSKGKEKKLVKNSRKVTVGESGIIENGHPVKASTESAGPKLRNNMENEHHGPSSDSILQTNEVSTQVPNMDCSDSSKKNVGIRFPAAVIERLRKVFSETQFPSRKTKEDLSKELGITFKQVNKWFSNTRNIVRSASSKKEKGSNPSIMDTNDPKASSNSKKCQSSSKNQNQKSFAK